MCETGCGRFADLAGYAPARCITCRTEPSVPVAKLATLSKRYGVTMAQLNGWYAEGCGINGCEGTNLHIDHNHDCCPKPPTCGKCTRGVLCTRHNVGLEAFLDSPSVIAYLRRTAAGRRTLCDYGLMEDAVKKLEPRMKERQVRTRMAQIKKKRYNLPLSKKERERMQKIQNRRQLIER